MKCLNLILLYVSDEHKMIVIHPDPESLKQKEARGAISNKWDSLIRQNRLFIIQQGIENTSWNQIKTIISKKNSIFNNINSRNCMFSTTSDINEYKLLDN